MKWNKYTYVCGNCDSLIEITTTHKDLETWCVCAESQLTLLSVEDATISPTNQTKEEKMETTFGATMTEMSEVDKLQSRITQLQEQVQRVTQRDFATASELHKMRDNMKEFTLEGLDDDSISEAQAEEIASICGFELSQEFELEVTVQYSITVNARDEESAHNIIHDIDFDSVSEPEGVTYLSATVDRIEG